MRYDLWCMKHKTTLWHKQSCCFALENILRAIYRALCAPGVLRFSLLLLFSSCFSWEVEDEEEIGWAAAGIHPDRLLCLLSPKMSKRTALSAFFKVNKILRPGKVDWPQDWLLLRVSLSTQTRVLWLTKLLMVSFCLKNVVCVI